MSETTLEAHPILLITMEIKGTLYIEVSGEHWKLKKLQRMIGGPVMGVREHLDWEHDQLTRASLTETRLWDRNTKFTVTAVSKVKEPALKHAQSIFV